MLGNFMQGGGAGKAKVLTDSGSIKLGSSAGLLLNSDDTNNVAIGTNALKSTTTAALSNIAIGTDSLTLVTTGDYNIGIGQDAISDVTTGSRNIGIGYQAGKEFGGNDCVFIGKDAGAAFNGGNLCTFIGSRCGEALQPTGTQLSGLTFVGFGCAKASTSTSMSQTTLIGVNVAAVESSYLGFADTLIGYNAGLNSTTGLYNTMVGTNAGLLHTGMTGNTLIGTSVEPASAYVRTGGYGGDLVISTFMGSSGSNGTIKRFSQRLTLSSSYTNAGTDDRAANVAIFGFAAYSFISRVYVKVKTLGFGTHKFSINLGTASDEATGDVVAGRVELLGANSGTGTVTRSQGALTSATDIDASTGATDEQVWISDIIPSTNSSVGWTSATTYLYVCHAGTGNETTDSGTDPVIDIIVEYY